MTPKQQKALAFIGAELTRTGGVPPTYDELGAHLGLRSRSGAHRIVSALERLGHIVLQPGRKRSLRLVGPDLTGISDRVLLAEVRRRGIGSGEARDA